MGTAQFSGAFFEGLLMNGYYIRMSSHLYSRSNQIWYVVVIFLSFLLYVNSKEFFLASICYPIISLLLCLIIYVFQAIGWFFFQKSNKHTGSFQSLTPTKEIHTWLYPQVYYLFRVSS